MYEIKVLSSKEFDEVSKSDPRYSYVNDSNMGFADRFKGKAYVRGTHLHDLNKYLVNHELEELEADKSTHEDENGIRHKKFFKEGVTPTWTGYNPSRDTWSPFGIGNIGSDREGNALRDQELFNQPSRQEFSVSPQMAQPQQTVFPQSGPLGSFSTSDLASGRVPESVVGSVGGQLGSGIGGGFGQQPQISPEVLENLRGFYAGRIPFQSIHF